MSFGSGWNGVTRSPILLLTILIVGAFLVVATALSTPGETPQDFQQRIVLAEQKPAPPPEPDLDAGQQALEAELRTIGEGFSGTAGIAVTEVATMATMAHDGDTPFPQQSVTKLGVAMTALDLVDTGAFGQLRLLVSDVVTARKILMEMNIPAFVNEVIAAEIEDKPGSLSSIMLPLMQADIRIEFMYAYIGGTSAGKAVMIFRFSDNDKAIHVLQRHGVKLLDAKTFNITEQD